MTRLTLFACLFALILSACGGDGSEAPAQVSVNVPFGTEIQEPENQRFEVRIALSPPVSSSLTIPLIYSGSATRDADYTVSAGSIDVPARATSGSVEIDVFRDFDAEGDETIEIGLGMIIGNGEPGATSDVTLTIVDGETWPDEKVSADLGPNLSVLPLDYAVTEESIEITALVLNTSDHSTAASQLHASRPQWSGRHTRDCRYRP